MCGNIPVCRWQAVLPCSVLLLLGQHPSKTLPLKDTQPRAELEQKAEECFLKAIDIAQHQQAKSLELRATTSLARLWQQQGKTKEAHQELATIYNWFTKGFDTKDLQEAKGLLDSLA